MENNLDKATAILKKLSGETLKTAVYLLELLVLKDELEATEELRNDDEANRQIKEARQARLKGKEDEYVPWEMRHGI